MKQNILKSQPKWLQGVSLRVLGLPLWPYHMLRKGGVLTIGQLWNLPLPKLQELLGMDEQLVREVQEKLNGFVKRKRILNPGGPVSGGDSGEDDSLDTTHPVSHQVTKTSVPLDALGLTIRPYNALRRHGITTVNQLERFSSEEILRIPNIGEKSLAEIVQNLERYQLEHPDHCTPHTQEESATDSGEQPWIEPSVLGRLEMAPLEDIPVGRLGLTQVWQRRLGAMGITTIAQLLSRSMHDWPNSDLVKTYLRSYLKWLANQNPSTWTTESTSESLSPVHYQILESSTIEELIQKWLSVLSERDQAVVKWRYGLQNQCLTLEEVGSRIGVTRERVRQLQKRSLELLSQRGSMESIHPLKSWLHLQIKRHEGLIDVSSVVTTMQEQLSIGEIDPAGVARLLFELDDQVKWLGYTEAWGFTSQPLEEIRGIQKRLVKILKEEKVPLSIGELLNRFRSSRFYQNRRSKLGGGFLHACLVAHPEIYMDDGDRCGLVSWQGHRTQEIVLALREIGEPAHYSVITERTNALLPPEQQGSEHNIHAQIQRLDDIFVRVGHGIYGLREWDLHDDGCIANAAYRVLNAANKPLHHDIITDRVLETWRVNRASVYVALQSDDRFINIGSGVYWLREKLTGEDEGEADFGELFGERLKRWQEELSVDEEDPGYDTHTEVDSIRQMGTDFFKR